MDQALYRKIVLEQIVVDSQEVAKEYEAKREEFKVPESARVGEIVLQSKETAKKVHLLVKANPEAFDSLATEYSTGQFSVRGGQTGLIRKGMMGEAYDKVVFKLKDGEISDPFNVRDSTWLIVKMVEHQPEHYRPFDEVKPMIESQLQREQQMQRAQDFLTKIRKSPTLWCSAPSKLRFDSMMSALPIK